MKTKLRTAVIGAGNMGKNHIRIYSTISQLVAVAEPIEKIGKPIAQKYKTKLYSDYKKMLDIEKPDAVSIVVPTKFHKIVALDCLKRKVPILIEKPITDNIIEAMEILQLAKINRTVCLVGHIERFNPAVKKLRQIIEKKRLGTIISLNAIRVGISPPPSTGSNVVLDLAIHDIDVFNYLLNQLPMSTSVLKKKLYEGNVSDSAAMLLDYGKAKGIIQTNWVTPIKMRKLYVTGTTGFVELDYITQKVVMYQKIATKRSNSNFQQFKSILSNPVKKVYISKKEPLKEELTYFLRCVQLKKPINSQFALDALTIALK